MRYLPACVQQARRELPRRAAKACDLDRACTQRVCEEWAERAVEARALDGNCLQWAQRGRALEQEGGKL